MNFGRRNSARFAAAALAALAISAPAAMAREAAPAEPTPTPKMTVAISKGTAATFAGSRALVPVRCLGQVARECVGTLSLETSAGTETVPYAIAAGDRRIVVVPLPAGAAPTVEAVTETMQSSGASARASRVLRLK